MIKKNDLLKMVDKFDLNENISFIDHWSNPYKWLAGAEAFLVGARWEGMPNVVLESLACATDVIATTECGGISEIMNDRHLIIVKPGTKFVEAMDNVRIRNKHKIGKNLLNRKFDIANVVPIINNWIIDLKLL